MKSPQWTQEEIETLKRLAAIRTPQNEIAIQLNRTRIAVSGKLYSLGLNANFKWSESEIDELRKLIGEGNNMTVAASRLGRAIETVQRKCKQLDITTPRAKILTEQTELKKQGLKRCSDCKEVKPLTKDFFRRSNGYCHLCERDARLKHSNSSIEVVLATRLRAAKARASKKKVTFAITIESLVLLWDKQGGKCFYTGKEMSLGGKGVAARVSPDGVSLDRISPEKGYVDSNVVLCCWAVNYMKGDYSADEFKAWCKTVCDFN